MLKVTVPAEHIEATDAFIEDQTIMTCETGHDDNGDLTIINHNDAPASHFWAFVEELLMFLPNGTEVKISK